VAIEGQVVLDDYDIYADVGVTATDSTASLQGPGSVGVRTVSLSPVTIRFDDLTARQT
jgi:hypothetical protein